MKSAKRWLCVFLLVPLLMSVAIPPTAAVAEKETIAKGVIKNPDGDDISVPVRKKASVDAEILKEFNNKDKINIIRVEKVDNVEWFVIDLGNNIEGFIHERFVTDLQKVQPTQTPSPSPTEEPTPEPTEEPTPEPTAEPTPEPTVEPTLEPTEEPTPEPTVEPTPVPTQEPTQEPTDALTPVPTEEPTQQPAGEPTQEPSPEPTQEIKPIPVEWTPPTDNVTDPGSQSAGEPTQEPTSDPVVSQPPVDQGQQGSDGNQPSADPNQPTDPSQPVDPTQPTTSEEPTASEEPPIVIDTTPSEESVVLAAAETMALQMATGLDTVVMANAAIDMLALPTSTFDYTIINSTYGLVTLPTPRVAWVSGQDAVLYYMPVAGSVSQAVYGHATPVEVLALDASNTWAYVRVLTTYGYMYCANLTFDNAISPSVYAYLYSSNPEATITLYDLTMGGQIAAIASFHSGMRVRVVDGTPATIPGSSSTNLYIKVAIEKVGEPGTFLYEGYVLSGSVTTYASRIPQPRSAVVKQLNIASGVTMRIQANTTSAAVGTYFNGTPVLVYHLGASWSFVEIQGKQGYVESKYLDFGTTITSEYATVNTSEHTSLTLFASDSLSSYPIENYPRGTRVRVISKGPDWTYVEVGGYRGYMLTKYLTFDGGSGGTPTVSYATVNNPNPTSYLNLRSLPTKNSVSLGRYYNGKSVRILEYGKEWCYVEVDGIIGYMMTMYLSFSGGGSGGGGGGSTGLIGYATVNTSSRLNLRERPTTGSRSLGLYSYGVSVKVISHYNSEWCYVQVGGQYGYMATRYLNFGSGSGSGGGSTARTAVVNNPISTQWLNLRELPSKSSRVLGIYFNGTIVNVLEYGSIWCRVEINGIRGYMMTTYLRFL